MHIYKVAEIANWFLAWAEHKETKITKLKLQKLLYYSQAHHLGDTGFPIFEEEIYAFPKGPFVKDLKYTSLKDGNTDKNDYFVNLTIDFDFDHFPLEVNQFLAVIWNTYGNLDANHLVNKTHKEITWMWNFSNESWDNREIKMITKDFMRNYYQLREMAA